MLRAVACGDANALLWESLEDPVDLPAAAQLAPSVPLVRKQDFGPRLLSRSRRGPAAGHE